MTLEIPKPKWSFANELMLSEYRHILDLLLQNINLHDDLFTCLLHRPVIERFFTFHLLYFHNDFYPKRV